VAIAASVFPMGKLEEMVNIGTLSRSSWSQRG